MARPAPHEYSAPAMSDDAQAHEPHADEPKAEILARLQDAFAGLVPHNRALGLTMVDYDRALGAATLSLPYRPELVGNPDTGVLHGGAITSLLDATCGAAVFIKLWSPTPVATLDLRIDYLRPATPGQAVVARAECHRLTANVAFVRATAFHEGLSDAVATAAGTFMVGTRGQFADLGRVRA